jgi:hypothetical protein
MEGQSPVTYCIVNPHIHMVSHRLLGNLTRENGFFIDSSPTRLPKAVFEHAVSNNIIIDERQEEDMVCSIQRDATTTIIIDERQEEEMVCSIQRDAMNER